MDLIHKTKRAILRFSETILRYDPVTRLRIHPSDTLKKLGTEYGGWVVPQKLLKATSICYSAGAGEDISFDCALAKAGCHVYIFDPTPRAQEHYNQLAKAVQNRKQLVLNSAGYKYDLDLGDLNLLRYYAYGLWSANVVKRFYAPRKAESVSHSIINLQKTDSYFEAPCKRLSDMMIELGHTKLDLLKIDIEGAEYEVINSIIEDRLDIKTICVEFDEINRHLNGDYLGRIRKATEQLKKAGYVLIAKDGRSNYTFTRKTI